MADDSYVLEKSNVIDDTAGVKTTETRQPGRTLRSRDTAVSLVVLMVLLGITLLLRTWRLNELPFGLWSDEAAYGLDARDVLKGQFHIFFPRAFGREPLFIYLLAPFISMWNDSAFPVRLTSALLGTLTVPVLYSAGRALWPGERSAGHILGLAAAGLWAVNYWAQSVNRVGFRVNTLPLLLPLAIVFWLLWTGRPTRRRAILFGSVAAVTLMTYLASRATLLLWPLLYIALPKVQRRGLRSTLPWVALSFAVVIAPLAYYFIANPQELFARVGDFDIVRSETMQVDRVQALRDSFRLAYGTFIGGEGDPNARHNLPSRPPFGGVLGPLFILGTGLALASIRRDRQRGLTLVAWWTILTLPAALSASANPHFIRLFGALPAALLLAAWPLAYVAQRLQRSSKRMNLAVVAIVTLLLVVEGTRTAGDYFVKWERDSPVYAAFQGEMWTFGDRVTQEEDAVAVVPLNPLVEDEFREYVLDYRYPSAEGIFLQTKVDEQQIERWLANQRDQLAGRKVLVPVWYQGTHAYADPKGVLSFYLEREGERLEVESQRGFDLQHFSISADPRFDATGNRIETPLSFTNGLTLVEGRWGVTDPQRTRGGNEIVGGGRVWAILTWRLEEPLANLKVAIDVVDEAGHRVGSSEQLLLDEQGRHVTEWQVGAVANTYHLLQVPSTQPPGTTIKVEVRAYMEDSLVPLQPAQGTTRSSIPIGALATLPRPAGTGQIDQSGLQRIDARLPGGVTLVAMDPLPAEAAPGTSATFRLFWQLEAESRSEILYHVSLAGTTGEGSVMLPPSIPANYVVHTYVDLPVPATAAPGRYPILLQGPDTQLELGELVVTGRVRQFEPPVGLQPLSATWEGEIELLGVQGAELTFKPGETVTLTFAWRAHQTIGRPLIRFVHLLSPDGKVVAQQDTVPCNQECPAASWLPGEILSDEAMLSLPPELPPGSYKVVVGWYDHDTLARVAVTDAAGAPLPDDLFALPHPLTITP